MAKSSQNLTSMSVDALLKLRDDIGAVLSKKVGELKHQLSLLTGNEGARGRTARKSAGKSLKGRKVAPKYRGPDGSTWAGRGATPRWMQEAIKGGAKKEDFLIAKAAPSRKKSSAKRSRKRKSAEG